jgi:hypothetical protein
MPITRISWSPREYLETITHDETYSFRNHCQSLSDSVGCKSDASPRWQHRGTHPVPGPHCDIPDSFPLEATPALRSPRDVFPLETALTQELVHDTNAAPGAAEPVVVAVAVVGVLRADHGTHPGRHPRAAQLPDRLDLLAHGIADYAPDGVAGIDAAAS